MLRLFSLPNLLSLTRIVAIPFLISFFDQGRFVAFFWILIVAALSDALDGYSARLLNVTSQLGKMLDPLADKLLLMSLFYLFWIHNLVPAWFLGLCIGRDLMIILGVLVMKLRHVPATPSPSLISKINTAAQMTFILWIVACRAFGWDISLFEKILFNLTLVTIFLSWCDYAILWIKLMRSSK